MSSPSMTPRQNEIWAHLAQGHTNREIARRLGLSHKTIKAHITLLFRSLGVVNRTQAAVAFNAAHPTPGEPAPCSSTK